MSSLLRLAAVLAVALLVAATGCGSGDGVGGQSAQEVLRTTFGPETAVSSGRLDVGVSLHTDGPAGAGGPARLTLRGPFDAPEAGGGIPAFAWDVALGAGGDTVTAGAVSTGRAGFVRSGGKAYAVDRATWARVARAYAADRDRSASAGGRTLGALGVDPLGWLRDPRRVGEEDVGGTATVHVRAGVDVPALLADVDRILARAGTAGAGAVAGRDVPAGLPAAQRRAIAASVRSATVDVFTGTDDGLLRRLNVQVAFAVPEASRAGAGGLGTGRLGLDLRLDELNEPQEITAPRNARPLAELTGATAPATPKPATPKRATPSTARPPVPADRSDAPYLRCIDAARGDLAKVQGCADLLRTP